MGQFPLILAVSPAVEGGRIACVELRLEAGYGPGYCRGRPRTRYFFDTSESVNKVAA
jgi:hypothetical protein